MYAIRSYYGTIIIGTAIPVSIIFSFVFMYFFDLSLNIVSLGGLTMGIGMLVDNSIVVLENIFRHREDGLSRAEAAYVGVKEVGIAVIASTFTTIAVFVITSYSIHYTKLYDDIMGNKPKRIYSETLKSFIYSGLRN